MTPSEIDTRLLAAIRAEVGGPMVAKDTLRAVKDTLADLGLMIGGDNAAELGKRCAEAISPSLFEPIARRAADDFYDRFMNTVQDYLCENVEWNIATRIAVAEVQARNERERAQRAEAKLEKLYCAVLRIKPVLDRAESNASGNPEWEDVSHRVNSVREAAALSAEPFETGEVA